MSNWRDFMEPELHDEPELGPCEACEGCEYCVPCGYDRMSCRCSPKIQDLEDEAPALEKESA